MRFLADGRQNLRQKWVCFDIFLVGLGTSSPLIIQPLRNHFSRSGNDNSSALAFLDLVLIFRILRLLRLLRALRLLPQFKTLWRLVQGLLSSMGTMLSMLALLTFTIYVFGCIGLEVITMHNKTAQDGAASAIRDSHFHSLPQAMLTLMQFVTLDSIAGIYGPLIDDNWWLMLYFLPIILILPVALMNLVTAVLVEAAMTMGKEDADIERSLKRRMLEQVEPEIHLAFQKMDKDKSGSLDQMEVVAAAGNLPAVLQDKIKPKEVLAFFDMLDIDGSGVEEADFVEGVFDHVMSDVPIQTRQMLKFLRLIWARIECPSCGERARDGAA